MSVRQILSVSSSILIATLGIVFIAIQVYVLLDIERYEISYLYVLIGLKGLFILFVIDVGLTLAVFHLFLITKNGTYPEGLSVKLFYVFWVLVLMWFIDWTFLETPMSVRIQKYFNKQNKQDFMQKNNTSKQAFEEFSLVKGIQDQKRKEHLYIMYERIRINSPDLYKENEPGSVIDKYAIKYDVDTTLIFFLNYIDSFYGEAVSRRVPYFNTFAIDTNHLTNCNWFFKSDTRNRYGNNSSA